MAPNSQARTPSIVEHLNLYKKKGFKMILVENKHLKYRNSVHNGLNWKRNVNQSQGLLRTVVFGGVKICKNLNINIFDIESKFG